MTFGVILEKLGRNPAKVVRINADN